MPKWIKIDNEKDLPNKEFDGPTRSMSISGKWIYHNKSREELRKLLYHELDLRLEWLDELAAIDDIDDGKGEGAMPEKLDHPNDLTKSLNWCKNLLSSITASAIAGRGLDFVNHGTPFFEEMLMAHQSAKAVLAKPLPSTAGMMKWVRASERLPEKRKVVPLKYHHDYFVGYFFSNGEGENANIPICFRSHHSSIEQYKFKELFWLDDQSPQPLMKK